MERPKLESQSDYLRSKLKNLTQRRKNCLEKMILNNKLSCIKFIHLGYILTLQWYGIVIILTYNFLNCNYIKTLQINIGYLKIQKSFIPHIHLSNTIPIFAYPLKSQKHCLDCPHFIIFNESYFLNCSYQLNTARQCVKIPAQAIIQPQCQNSSNMYEPWVFSSQNSKAFPRNTFPLSAGKWSNTQYSCWLSSDLAWLS